MISNTDRTSAVPPLDTKDLYRSTPSPPLRPKSAPPIQSPRFTPTPPKSARPSVSSDFHPTPSSGRPQSARPRSSRPRSSKSLSASSKAGLSASKWCQGTFNGILEWKKKHQSHLLSMICFICKQKLKMHSQKFLSKSLWPHKFDPQWVSFYAQNQVSIIN